MEKKTFLGFDFTPRWALWRCIDYLRLELKEVREALKRAGQDRFELQGRNASLTESLRTADAERAEYLKRCAELEERLARYERPKDSKGRFCKKTQQQSASSFAPSTVRLCGLEWMTEPLTGFGGTEVDGRTYYTQDEAIAAAEQIGHGWRLATKEEHVALAALGSTWVDKGPWGLPGRWFGGNHDTDHEGSVFYEASGFRDSYSGGLGNVGTVGYSWSSSPYSASSVGGSILVFSSGYVNPEGGYSRAYGFPVRLVREAKE